MRTVLLLAVILAATVSRGFADKLSPDTNDPNNVPPPSGAILDLAGTPIHTAFTQYSVNFTAAFSTTDVTFLFRNDPGFTGFDDVSVTDVTHPAPNLLLNPGFELGNVGGAPVDWTFDNVFGAGFAGSVATSCFGAPFPHSGSNGWCDGATQAYDAIDQKVSTTIGDTYTISFWQSFVDVNGFAGPDYQQVSTNGHNSDTDTDGNGIDTLVYVGQSIPTPVPEPVSVMLLGTAVLVLSYRIRKRFGK